MTSDEFKKAIELHGKWRRDEGGVRLVLRGSNLRGSNLRGSNLSGSDLSDSDLRGSDLRGSDLRGSNLRGSNLRGSNLSGSNLRGSNLSGSDLSDSDLRDSDLSGSDLSGSNLRGSDLSDSNLRGSNLRGAEGDPLESVPAIDSLHAKILEAIGPGAKKLDMGAWHSSCGTTHCRAGWVVTLAGEAGKLLEAKYGTPIAAAFIECKSEPKLNWKVPNYYAGNNDALADIKRLAGVS